MTNGQRWGLTVAGSAGPSGTASMTISGRVSKANALRLAEALDGTIATGARQVVVDLQGVDYVSSAGLQVLGETSARLVARGGALVLLNVQAPVRVALDLAGISSK